MKSFNGKKYLNIPELAAFLGCEVEKARGIFFECAKDGRITGYKLGARYFITEREAQIIKARVPVPVFTPKTEPVPLNLFQTETKPQDLFVEMPQAPDTIPEEEERINIGVWDNKETMNTYVNRKYKDRIMAAGGGKRLADCMRRVLDAGLEVLE